MNENSEIAKGIIGKSGLSSATFKRSSWFYIKVLT